MKKKYFICSIVCSILLTIFLGLVMPDKIAYGNQHLVFTINMRVEKDITCKMFYLGEGQTEFTEQQAITIPIKGSNDFVQTSFIIPIDNVSKIRFDFGNAPGFVDIGGLSYYDGNKDVDISLEELDKFDKYQIEAGQLGDGLLTYYSTGENPYIYGDCNASYQWNKTSNRRYVYMAIYFVVLSIVCYLLLLAFAEEIKSIYHARKQIMTLAINDFKSRYTGSYLGRIWGVIQPIMTIFMFWFVFQVGLRSGAISDVPFILWLVAAMIPWNFFSDAWLSGNGAFTGYSYIVKKVVFNIDILPLVKIIGSSILNLIFNVIIILLYSVYGRFPGIHIIDMIYYTICLTFLALGLSMISATLNVFMKDVSQFLGIAIQYLMWFTPIMWQYTMIPETSKLSLVYKLNPLFYVLNGYRESLIEGKWFYERYTMMIYYWTVTIVILLIGMNLMKKLKPHFADVL